MATESSVCQYFKYGYCRYRENCRHQHVHETCENNDCNISTCNRRHPLPCKYFSVYQRCKFGEFCIYKHVVAPRNVEEIDSIKKKVNALESHIESLNSKFSELLKKVSTVIESSENTLDTVTRNETIFGDVQELVRVTDIHKCKLDVFNEEFFAYSKVVDALEGKVSQLQINVNQILHPSLNLNPAAPNFIGRLSVPPTPPSTSRKKSRI